MKRVISLFLVITGMICIMGCSDTPEKGNKMYIEPAQLTDCCIAWVKYKAAYF